MNNNVNLSPLPINEEVVTSINKLTIPFSRFLENLSLNIRSRARWLGAHVSGKSYRKNDMVTFSGGLYIANTRTKEAPGTTDWDVMA